MASNRTPAHPSYPSSSPYSTHSSHTSAHRLNSDPLSFKPYQFTASYSAETSTKLHSKRDYNFSEYPKMQSFSLYDKDMKSKAKDTYNYKYLVSPVAFRKTHVSKFHDNNRTPPIKTSVRKERDVKIEPLKPPVSHSEPRVQNFPISHLDSSSKDYSFIKELHEKFLVCKLCFKSFEKPKTLLCLHSFCEDCLHKHKEKDPGILNRNRLLCPVCGVKTELPFGGVRRLPESHMISNLNQVLTNRINREMKVLSVAESFASRHSYHGSVANSVYNFLEFEEGNGDKSATSNSMYVKYWCGICAKANKLEDESSSFDCENNDKELVDKNQDISSELSNEGGLNVSECRNEIKKEATVECLDCSAKMLCDECAELHRSAEITCGHSLVAIELARKGRLQCEFHEKEMIRYFCETCDTCVCVLCAFNRHKTHKIVTFAEGIECQLKILGEKFELCRNTSDSIKEQLEHINKFEGRVFKVENLIKEQTNELMAKLKEKEQEALDRLKSLTDDEKIVEFLDQKDKIESLLKPVDMTFKFIEKVLSGKSVDIFLVKKVLEEKMKDLLEWVTSETPETVKGPMWFVPSKQEIQFGELVMEGPSNDKKRTSEENSSAEKDIQANSESNKNPGVESDNNSNSSDESDKSENEITQSDKQDDAILSINKTFSEMAVQTTEEDEGLVKEKDFKNESKKEHLIDMGTNTDKFESLEESLQVSIKPESVSVGVITDNLTREDKGTVTVSTSITTAYKDFIENLNPKVLTINRGTMTVKESKEDENKRVKLISAEMVDRATSPIRILKFDKAVMASKAEVREQKEVFHRAGMCVKPKKIINEMFAENLLDSIHEDDAEEEENGETQNRNVDQMMTTPNIFSHVKDCSNRISCVPKSRMLLKPLPTNSEQPTKNKSNSAVVRPMNSPFRNNMKLPNSMNNQASSNTQTLETNRHSPPSNHDLFATPTMNPLLFGRANLLLSRGHVDTSTNTRSVFKEDKSTGTDSPPVVEKMAECISKLKTVRHRLECLHTSQNSSDSIDGSRYDNVRAGSEGSKSDDSRRKHSFDNNDPPTLINSMISNQASPEFHANQSGNSSAFTSLSTSDNEINNKNKSATSLKEKTKVPKEKSSLENRPSTPCTSTMKRNKKNLPKLKDVSDQSHKEEHNKTRFTNSNSSSYNSSESSCNNSPSIQRSMKLALHRPLSSPGNRPNSTNQAKPPITQPKTPPSSARRNKPPSFLDQKTKSRLTDLSDSLHSESSEDQEKVTELPSGMPDFSTNKFDLPSSPGVYPKRASTIFKPHSSSLHRRNKIEGNQGLLKTPKERHKSPRPPKR